MSDESVPTQRCENCKRDVPISNLVAHTVYCQRNNWWCPLCGKVMQARERDQHERVVHQPVSCDACGKTMDGTVLDHHKNAECPMRVYVCPWCALDVVEKDREQHSEFCGSRTERCEKCGRFIMCKEWECHLATNCEYPSLPPAQQPPSPETVLNRLRAQYAGDLLYEPRIPDSPVAAADTWLCPRCGGRFEELDALQIHVVTSCAKTDSNEALDEITGRVSSLLDKEHEESEKSENVQPTRGKDTDQTEPSIPCEFCGNLFLPNSLFSHQLECEEQERRISSEEPKDMEEEPKDDDKEEEFKDKAGEEPKESKEEPKESKEELKDYELLPCEVCGVEYPATCLEDHQNQCLRDQTQRIGEFRQRELDRSIETILDG
eukprot:TRINITY_DN3095_c0_g1_i1.p1 TRINITY_DN3095_c0_g1~~TRINITY_DN3095_c0_g1_i1.p1  ORF type:complete len:377 (-),score=79.52 TRINITY_DN3095_c0_g1_i1:7-1137(-)